MTHLEELAMLEFDVLIHEAIFRRVPNKADSREAVWQSIAIQQGRLRSVMDSGTFA